MKMMNGLVYENEVKEKNCIAMIDNPTTDDIKWLFGTYKKANTLIYKNGNIQRAYLRADYE